MTIAENLQEVREKIDSACAMAGRKNDVKLIAVTKTRTVDEINTAIELGVTDIGENRVQEVCDKFDKIKKSNIHLIGQLQTNKVKYILDKVTLIHSLDRLSLAEQVDKLAQKNNLDPINTLIEINIGHEETKSGIFTDNLSEFLDILSNFRYINPMGLMTVAPATATEYELERYFDEMREALRLGQGVFGEKFCELSMGMSRDYVQAIKYGSTMVRIGTSIFGKRNYDI